MTSRPRRHLDHAATQRRRDQRDDAKAEFLASLEYGFDLRTRPIYQPLVTRKTVTFRPCVTCGHHPSTHGRAGCRGQTCDCQKYIRPRA